jgi:negative regulator of sigma E activity
MNNNDFDRIEAYLNGAMTEAERSRFEAEMTVNEELASAFRLYQSIEYTMRSRQESGDEASLKQTLDDLGALYFAAEHEEKRKREDRTLQPPAAIVEENPPDKADKGIEWKGKRQGVIRASPFWVRLAVAVSIAGIVVLGIAWYLKQMVSDSGMVVNKKERPAIQTDKNKKVETPTRPAYPDTAACFLR